MFKPLAVRVEGAHARFPVFRYLGLRDGPCQSFRTETSGAKTRVGEPAVLPAPRLNPMVLAYWLLFFGTSAYAAPMTFNLTGTFQDGTSFGPGSQITLDPSQTAGLALGISSANVTLVGRDGAILAAFTQADVASSSTQPSGWSIGICKYQPTFPPFGLSDSCSAYPIINVFLPVSLYGYPGGSLCIIAAGGCFAPTFYKPDGLTFEFLVSGSLLPSNVSGNLPRFTYNVQTNMLGSNAIAVDSTGNTYLTGSVPHSPFTATPGAYQSLNAGQTCPGGGGIGPPPPIPCSNGFVIKLDPSGSPVFATYLGGSGSAQPSAIAVDPSGNVYVAGTLNPPFNGSNTGIFPVTLGAAFSSGSGFVSKLSPDGTQLLYSTLLPSIYLHSIAVDQAGEVYFVGEWSSLSSVQKFPVTAGAYQTTPGDTTASTVVGKLNDSGSALIYATYLSGPASSSSGSAIAVDSAGNAIVSGNTEGADFPATAGQFSNSDPDGRNAFIAKLNADGSRLMYATLLGPGTAGALKVNPAGDIFVICFSSADFPVTAAGFGVAAPIPPLGADDNFLVHIGPDGSTVKSSIYVPFNMEFSQGGALDVDTIGNAYVAGDGNVQTTPGAFQVSSSSSPQSVVVAKVGPDGQVAGAAYTGTITGNGDISIAAENDGSVVVAGPVASVNLPNLTSTSPSFFVLNFFPAMTVENSASYAANAVAGGELVAIQGYGLGPVTGQVSTPVNSLGGVQVFFDNFPAPLIYAQAGQLNAQVPWEIAGQTTTTVRIVSNGVSVGSAVVPVTPTAPGVFYIVNANGTRNLPQLPAHAGDLISLYATGGGPMSIAGVDGGVWPLSTFSHLAEPLAVKISGEAAAVGYAGSAPTLSTGYFQINAGVPADLKPGQQTVVITIGGVQSIAIPLFIQ